MTAQAREIEVRRGAGMLEGVFDVGGDGVLFRRARPCRERPVAELINARLDLQRGLQQVVQGGLSEKKRLRDGFLHRRHRVLRGLLPWMRNPQTREAQKGPETVTRSGLSC